MKTRNGFVSNSSSSSFIIISTLKSHNKALKKLNNKQKKLIEKSIAIKKLGSEDICMLAIFSSDDGASTDSGWFDDVTLDKVPDGFGKDSYTFGDVVDAYSETLKEENKDTITVLFP